MASYSCDNKNLSVIFRVRPGLTMPFLMSPLTYWLPKLTVAAVVDILVVAFLIYQLIMVFKGTRAAQVLAGIVVLLAVYVLAVWMRAGTVAQRSGDRHAVHCARGDRAVPERDTPHAGPA